MVAVDLVTLAFLHTASPCLVDKANGILKIKDVLTHFPHLTEEQVCNITTCSVDFPYIENLLLMFTAPAGGRINLLLLLM